MTTKNMMMNAVSFFAAVTALTGWCETAAEESLPLRESLRLPKSGLPPPVMSPLFLKPGDGNVMFNSSFELGMVGHAVYTFTPFELGKRLAKTRIVEQGAVHGSRALEIDSREAECDAVLYRSNGPRVPTLTNVVYSVWLKADRPSKAILVLGGAVMDGSRYYMPKDGRVKHDLLFPIGNGSTRKEVKLTTDWQRYEIAYTTVEAQSFLSPSVRFPEKGVYWIDAEQLEVAKTPHDYRPAAEKEAAYVLAETVYAQRAGECPERTAEFRTCDYAAKKSEVKSVTFKTPKFGKFALEGEYGGRPALPAEYAVVHELDPYPGTGFRCGFNLAATMSMPFERRRAFQQFEGMDRDKYFRLVRLGGMNFVHLWGGGIGFDWQQIEPEKGKFDWSMIDYTAEGIEKAGMRFLLGVDGALKKKKPGEGPHDGWFMYANAKHADVDTLGWGYWSMEPDLKDVADFTAAMVRRYKGRCVAYEIEGEPNLKFRNMKYFVSMMKTFYETVKREDPSAAVIGITGTGDCGGDVGGFTGWVGENGGFKYFDWLGFHPYATPTDVTPKTAEWQLDNMRELLAKYGRKGVPLYEGECFFLCDNQSDDAEPKNGPGGNWPPTYLARRYILDCAGGCIASVPLSGEQLWAVGPETPGMCAETDYCFRPYPRTLYVVSNACMYFLEGATFLEKPDWRDGLNGATFRDRHGRKVTAFWAKRPSDCREWKIPAGVKAYDLYGNPIAGESFRLTEDVVYLVEEGK